jgi:hypothetical protein
MEESNMKRWIVVSSLWLGVATLGGAFSPAAAADVSIGVHFGIPAPVLVAPPVPVVVAPAPVVVAPPAPVVIAPGAPVYYYGASYYTHYNGAWFVGPGHGGPWNHVHVRRVPRPIIAVPHAYLHVPRGHGHHIAGPPPWAHGHRHGPKHGHKFHRHRDRD